MRAPPSSSMSPMTSLAPSAANRRTVARPIPEHPPVITATRPSMRPATWSFLSGRDEDVLLLGERIWRVRAELPAEAGHLVAAERRPVADARMAVHTEVARLDTARDPQCAAQAAGVDRPRQPVLRVVRQRDRLVLVVERHHGHQ